MRSAFFLEGTAGGLFCTGFLHDQEKQPRRKFLIISPFAEELNKSRHVLAALCLALGEGGHDVLMPDLYGTGDSAGDFGEATLEIWRRDIDNSIAHLNPKDGLELIGLRAGALLAADAAERHPVQSLTLLHPVVEGRQQLTQMLRLRLAGGLTAGGKKETASQLRQRLAQGEGLEIAGYRLSGRLAADLEGLSLKGMALGGVERINWIELAPEAERPLMPASQAVIAAWGEHRSGISTTVIACDQFWATQEIAHCPGLVHATLQQLAT